MVKTVAKKTLSRHDLARWADMLGELDAARIGERLELTRQALGMSQAEFCRRAGVSPSLYNNYHTQNITPKVRNAARLALAHRLTLDWIYLGDPSGLDPVLFEAIKALRKVRA